MGVEAMRRCKPTETDLLAPVSQPDRTMHSTSKIAWMRRHGPRPGGIDEVLSRAEPILEPVSESLIDKLNRRTAAWPRTVSSRACSKSSTLAKSQSAPGLHRKKPPIASQKYM